MQLIKGQKVLVINEGIGYIYEKATNSEYYYIKFGKNYKYINIQYINHAI